MSDARASEQHSDVTRLLLDWENGDEDAVERLIPLVFEDLRRRAAGFLRRERSGHTLQPTALVNEAYMRLVDQKRVHWQSRNQFFAVAAKMMRRILVDHARKRHAAKRGDGVSAVSLEAEPSIPWQRDVDLIALDDALTDLEAFAPRQSQVVELKFFGGLEVTEIAEIVEVSPASVKLDWQKAKAWLYHQITPNQA